MGCHDKKREVFRPPFMRMFSGRSHLRHPPPKEPLEAPPNEPLLPPEELLPPEKPGDLPAEWHELHVPPTEGATELLPEGAANVLFCKGALPIPPAENEELRPALKIAPAPLRAAGLDHPSPALPATVLP